MANHKSARKCIRQTEVRTQRNASRMNRIRTFVKRVISAIETGNKELATNELRLAEPELVRGAKRNLLHRNTASRTVSRLAARIKAIA